MDGRPACLLAAAADPPRGRVAVLLLPKEMARQLLNNRFLPPLAWVDAIVGTAWWWA
jgi:hypothetical protein